MRDWYLLSRGTMLVTASDMYWMNTRPFGLVGMAATVLDHESTEMRTIAAGSLLNEVVMKQKSKHMVGIELTCLEKTLVWRFPAFVCYAHGAPWLVWQMSGLCFSISCWEGFSFLGSSGGSICSLKAFSRPARFFNTKPSLVAWLSLFRISFFVPFWETPNSLHKGRDAQLCLLAFYLHVLIMQN